MVKRLNVYVTIVGTWIEVSVDNFVLLTCNCVRGLPLGILIFTSESQSTLTAALNLYMQTMDDNGLFDGGAMGQQF